MSEFLDNVQEKIKGSSGAFALVVFKIISVFTVALVLALIGETLFQYGDIAFLFLFATCGYIFYRFVKSWTWSQMIVFDVICVLIAVCLRMYILLAPGA